MKFSASTCAGSASRYSGTCRLVSRFSRTIHPNQSSSPSSALIIFRSTYSFAIPTTLMTVMTISETLHAHSIRQSGQISPFSLPNLRSFHAPSGAVQILASVVRLECLRRLESVGVLDANDSYMNIFASLKDSTVKEAAIRDCIIIVTTFVPVDLGAARIIKHCQQVASLWAGSLHSLRLLAKLEVKPNDPEWIDKLLDALSAFSVLELLCLDQADAFLDDRCSESTTQVVHALAHRIPTLNRVLFGSDPFWRTPPAVKWEWRIDRYTDTHGVNVVDCTIVHDCKG